MKQGRMQILAGAATILCMATFSFAAGETKPAASSTAQPAVSKAAKPTGLKVETKKGGEKKKQSATSGKKVVVNDINSSSAAQLKALGGLSDAEVRKIIAGRPYKRVEELKYRQILVQPVYDSIKEKIVAIPPGKLEKVIESTTVTETTKATKAGEATKTGKATEAAKSTNKTGKATEAAKSATKATTAPK